MNRWISNLVLGLFALVLVTAYGVAKQPSVYSLSQLAQPNSGGQVQSEQQAQTMTDLNTATLGVKTVDVTFPDGKVFTMVVMDTEAGRKQGLSGVASLQPSAGMLFVFDADAPQSMWMKEMNFPLDMIWLDGNKQVVHIEQNVPKPTADEISLPTYQSSIPARYVIEVGAGTTLAEKLGVGQTLTWSQN